MVSGIVKKANIEKLSGERYVLRIEGCTFNQDGRYMSY